MRLEIHENVSQQPNGDRDTRRHPCSSFRVVLINGAKNATLFKNDQFDNFHCHIRGTRAEYLAEAVAEAKVFAETMGCPLDEQPTQVPGRIAELKERISKDRAELRKLEQERDR